MIAIPESKKIMLPSPLDKDEWQKWIKPRREWTAKVKLKLREMEILGENDGDIANPTNEYNGTLQNNVFVAWLIKRKGFKCVNIEETYI